MSVNRPPNPENQSILLTSSGCSRRFQVELKLSQMYESLRSIVTRQFRIQALRFRVLRVFQRFQVEIVCLIRVHYSVVDGRLLD